MEAQIPTGVVIGEMGGSVWKILHGSESHLNRLADHVSLTRDGSKYGLAYSKKVGDRVHIG